MEKPDAAGHPTPWFEEPGYVRRIARLESIRLAGDGNPLWNLDPSSRPRRRTYDRPVLSGGSIALRSRLQRVLATVTGWGTLLTERILSRHRLSVGGLAQHSPPWNP
jgi:hypothetical protein